METEVRLEPFEIARTTVVSAGLEQPVHGVTWRDAINHCNALSDAEGLRPAYTVEGPRTCWDVSADGYRLPTEAERSEEHTSELQSRGHLVCRLLLEKQ